MGAIEMEETSALLSGTTQASSSSARIGAEHDESLERVVIPGHLFKMTPADVRSLMQHDRAATSQERRSPRMHAAGDDTDARDTHMSQRLVLDPCLGRWDLLCAKGRLCLVLVVG